MGKLRNYFKFAKQKNGSYRVNYRKDGIVTYITVNTKWEVNKLQKTWKSKQKKKVSTNEFRFVGGIHNESELEEEQREKKKKLTVDEWYKKLHSEDCFVLENHHIRMYTKSGKQRKFYHGENFVSQVAIIKFYLVKSTFKIGNLPDHPLVEFAKVRGSKQLRSSQKILCIKPRIVWRDNRPAFDFPKMNLQELDPKFVTRFWKVGHPFEIVRVGDIPSSTVSVTYDKKFDFEHWKKKSANSKRQKTRKRNKIMNLPVEQLPEGSVEYDIPARSKREKRTYNSSVSATDKRINSIQRKLDKLKK